MSALPRCHYCEMPVHPDDKPIFSKCGTAVLHMTCWYDGGPFRAEDRDPVTGKLPPYSQTRAAA